MDKFLIQKRKRSEDEPSTSSNTSAGVTIKYKDSFLAFGFTWTGDESLQIPICLVCGEKLSNESLVPNKLKRHLKTKHAYAYEKPLQYFQRLLAQQNKSAQKMVNQMTVSDRALEASYLVAELVAKKMKPHTIAEELILPACETIVETMLGKDAAAEIRKVPLSNNTIHRRIGDMSGDIEDNVKNKLLVAKKFALQIDESTDVTSNANLLGFGRFVDGTEIIEQFLFCRKLAEKNTGNDIFTSVNSFLKETGLKWTNCCAVCNDGAPAMTGRFKGFVALVKRENPNVITTHCFLHREALVSKTVGPELKTVLDEVIKMVNYIKANPLKTRIFERLCEAKDSPHRTVLLHNDVRWLSRGRILNRFLELKHELLEFFSTEKPAFQEKINDKTWCLKLAYLSDIFLKFNNLNTSMQGPKENLITSANKIKGFSRKLQSWKQSVAKGDLCNFPSVVQMAADTSDHSVLVDIIMNHLSSLEAAVQHYFPSLSTEGIEWVIAPFSSSSVDNAQEFTPQQKDELLDLSSECTLTQFWLTDKAIDLLLPFSTSYLCEEAFSALNTIKSKTRSRLIDVEMELRVCLSKIRPRLQKLCSSHQVQLSH
ncbi:SCAN domain-containing protein 3-like [Hyperolius riggenbachi]|uniref:SCAN domain-containing protein 3-like n=1 Tax=Hyperolius riggenbachi TaxID=752182 RepID=UPI0035A2BF2C